MKRLALFWLVCAAAGFAVAASVAVVLSITVDGGGLRSAARPPSVRAMELRPANQTESGDPQDVGHKRLMPW